MADAAQDKREAAALIRPNQRGKINLLHGQMGILFLEARKEI